MSQTHGLKTPVDKIAEVIKVSPASFVFHLFSQKKVAAVAACFLRERRVIACSLWEEPVGDEDFQHRALAQAEYQRRFALRPKPNVCRATKESNKASTSKTITHGNVVLRAVKTFWNQAEQMFKGRIDRLYETCSA
jgi:hypothetical protein